MFQRRQKTEPTSEHSLLTSANDVPYHEAISVARTENIDIVSAREKIFREKLAAGEASNDSLAGSLRRALGLESKAEKELRQAQEERYRVEQLQREWEHSVANLEHFRTRKDSAWVAVANLKNGIESFPQEIEARIGIPQQVQDASDLAMQLGNAVAALPFLEAAAAAIEEKYWQRVEEVRALGITIGVPKDARESLPQRS